ncbi:hypothetical protein FQ187_05485 [Pseudomonas sp. ANT_J28]|nr:hypothetical protein FQ187_05485 [Pseudomonas sp. ANT_J28]
MPSTLTARVNDGKRSKKIERNPRKVVRIEILLRGVVGIVFMFARGLNDAQLKAFGDGACQRGYS